MKRRGTSGRTALLLAAAVLVAGAVAVALLRGSRASDVSTIGPGEEAPAAPRDVVALSAPSAEAPDERIAEPAPDAPVATEDERAAPALALGPTFELHVRDRSTRSTLSGIELVCISAAYARAEWYLPAARDEFTSLGDSLASPITLRIRESGTELADALLVGDGGRAPSRPVVLGEPLDTTRALVFFARTAGTSWGRAAVEVTSGGEREILLDASASLHVRLVNARPEDYAALGVDASLFVRRPDAEWMSRTAEVVELDAEMARDGYAARDVPADRYAVSVELGERYGQNERVVLAEREVVLAPGARVEIELALDDPPPPVAPATLAGTLAFPPFPGSDAAELHLYSLASGSYRAVVELPVAEMERAGASTAFAWSAELPPGRYQAKVWPLLVSTIFDLPPEGRWDADLELPPLASVEVEVVAALDGEPVAVDSIFWSPRETDEDNVNHIGSTVEPGAVGRFHFTTVPGPLSVSVWEPPPPFGATYSPQDAVAGDNVLRVELAPVYGVRIVLREGDAVLPHAHELYWKASEGLRQLDGDGRVVTNRIATDGFVEVNAPGTYELALELPEDADYRAPPPQTVEVVPGEYVEVVVELERR